MGMSGSGRGRNDARRGGSRKPAPPRPPARPAGGASQTVRPLAKSAAKTERVAAAAITQGPLLPWLLAHLPAMNRTRIKPLLQHGRIRVNGIAITKHDHELKPGDIVELGPNLTSPHLAKLGIRIVHEDDAIVVIDKPFGLLTVATDTQKEDTAVERLNEAMAVRHARAFVVHRLDRETSGLLLFAKSADIRDTLQENWDAVTKQYLAVVVGTLAEPEGLLESSLLEGPDLKVRKSVDPEAKLARTRYQFVRRVGRYSLLEVTLETGRKHQIRVHLADAGCPIIGDDKYGSKHNPARRLGLHSWKLAFPHPVSKKLIQLESPLPAVLAAFVATEPEAAG